MTGNIDISEAGGTWVVRAGGAVIGESENALKLTVGDLAAVIYFPREDIATAFLEPSTHSSHCPQMGDATYFSIQTKSTLLENAVWSYESPLPGAERIKDHLAFRTDETIAVEQV